MPEHIEVRTTKATVRIDNQVYDAVVKKLHYGQLTSLIRTIFHSLKILIDRDEFFAIVNYMNGLNELNLPKTEVSRYADGKNRNN